MSTLFIADTHRPIKKNLATANIEYNLMSKVINFVKRIDKHTLAFLLFQGKEFLLRNLRETYF